MNWHHSTLFSLIKKFCGWFLLLSLLLVRLQLLSFCSSFLGMVAAINQNHMDTTLAYSPFRLYMMMWIFVLSFISEAYSDLSPFRICFLPNHDWTTWMLGWMIWNIPSDPPYSGLKTIYNVQLIRQTPYPSISVI